MNISKKIIFLMTLPMIFVLVAFIMSSFITQPERPETNVTPPFYVGERMTYEVRLVNSSGAYVLYKLNLSVTEISTINGRACFVLRGEYLGYDFVIYSFVTKDNLTLLKTLMESPVGSATITYDYEKRKCEIFVLTNKDPSPQRAEADIKPYLQDPLSTVYYIRSLPLSEGYWCTFNQIDVMSGLTSVIKVSVRGLSNISTAVGAFDCYEISLEARGSKTIVYITTTGFKVPVKVEVPYGRDTFQVWELIEYSSTS
ncbi:MAG: DUF3108 domain-containing protein [Candidatus Nezhaarchaeales archaeon]